MSVEEVLEYENEILHKLKNENKLTLTPKRHANNKSVSPKAKENHRHLIKRTTSDSDLSDFEQSYKKSRIQDLPRVTTSSLIYYKNLLEKTNNVRQKSCNATSARAMSIDSPISIWQAIRKCILSRNFELMRKLVLHMVKKNDKRFYQVMQEACALLLTMHPSANSEMREQFICIMSDKRRSVGEEIKTYENEGLLDIEI